MALTEKQFQDAASKLGVTTAHIKAFVAVEASGNGFLQDGRPKILFERHVFYRLLKSKRGEAFANEISANNSDICSPSTGGYATGPNSDARGVAEHKRLARATAIDRECGLQAASWGAGQVMGENWKRCGYVSLQAFVNAAYKEQGQLDMIVGYLKSDPKIIKAMLDKDWDKVAELYNGRNYAANNYHVKLADAYTENGGK